MAGSIVVGQLLQKAAEIRGRIATLEGAIAREREALAHIQAAVRMFDPEQDATRVKPRRPRMRRTRHFAHGELTQRCRAMLREGEAPFSADDLARKAMADKCLDPDDRKLRSDFIRRFLWALLRQHAEGQAQKIGHGLGVRWFVA